MTKSIDEFVEPGNTYLVGRLSTVDLLIKAACLLNVNNVNIKEAVLNKLAHSGQLYLAFPFSKVSLGEHLSWI
jgi:hypothetical protein